MGVKLEVRSRGPNGFRRAGRFFGPEPVTVELEDEQADTVMRERQLYVRRLDGGAMPDVPKEQPSSGLGDGSAFMPSDDERPAGLSLDDPKPTGTRRATVPDHDKRR